MNETGARHRLPAAGACAAGVPAILAAAMGAALFAAVPAGAGGTPEEITGDYTVFPGETIVLTNRTLVISGNVTIETGGTLILQNATLLLNLSANGSRTLAVEPGGTLRALDLDGLSQTAYDRSLIGSADPAVRFAARFKAGANVLVRNSAVSGFGHSLLSPGLLVESDNVTFEGASLEAYVYLRVEGASPSFEGTTLTGDGTGSNYFFGSNATLANCTLSRHVVALSASNGSRIELSGGLVRDSVFSFAANASTIKVRDSAVNNSSSGVFLTNGSFANFTDVSFNEGALTFGDAASQLAVVHAYVFRVLNGAAESVRNASVSVRDGANATVAGGNTGSVGAVGPVYLLASTANSTGRYDEQDYTVTAQKSANSTSYTFSALLETSPVTLLLSSNVDPRIALTAPAPGAVLLAGVPQLFEVNATDPDLTPGGITVAWRSSLDGPLGAGLSLPLALGEGMHSIEVEARDLADGFRRISFNVTVEAGRAETVTVEDGALSFNVTLWKTSVGTFDAILGAGPTPPPLAVGRGLEVHATSGNLIWAWAWVEMAFDPAALPYGTFEQNLTVAHFTAGAWQTVAGAAVDLNRSVIAANVSSADGLGWFLVVAVKGPNLPPAFPPYPRLAAVVGRPFAFTVTAADTPGDAVSYSLRAAPAWLSIDSGSGALVGVPGAADRGLITVVVAAGDPFGANSTAALEIFVSGALENRAPSLVNPAVLPREPVEREAVIIQVTYFDPDDDLPLFLEVVIDGAGHAMDPVNLADINTTDGKEYVFRSEIALGRHNISFRTNDGAPGHADVTLAAPDLVVASDTLRGLNNWFLALFASVAATLALALYFRTRAPRTAPPPRKEAPEDRATFLEGADLKPIPPQPPMSKKKPSREEALEKEADLRADRAAEEEESAAEKLSGGRRED